MSCYAPINRRVRKVIRRCTKCTADNSSSRTTMCLTCTNKKSPLPATEPVVGLMELPSQVQSPLIPPVASIECTLRHIRNRQDAISILASHGGNERAASALHLFRVANYYFSVNDYNIIFFCQKIFIYYLRKIYVDTKFL